MTTSTNNKKRAGKTVQERLLEAALDIFNEKGYAATSVREIVEAAGVTKPVLYYYFKSKEGIYLEFFKKPFEVLEITLNDSLIETPTARTRIMQLFDQIFQLVIHNLKAARLMYAIYYGPPQGAPFFDFDGYHLKVREVIKKIVRSGIRNGEFAAVDPDIFSYVLMAAHNFAMEEQLCHHAPQIDRKGLAKMLELIFDGNSNLRMKTKAKTGRKR